MLTRILSSIVLFLISPGVFACAVCGFGQDQSQSAYILTAGILTFLPLILAGALAIIVWRRVRAAREQELD